MIQQNGADKTRLIYFRQDQGSEEVLFVRIAMGAKSLTELMTTLSKAGLREGDATTQPHLEKYCGWVQTTYFDGITVAGASLF